MSWSVAAKGRVAAVKASLEKQFANARSGVAHVPHEAASVDAIEKIVNDQLDFLTGCKTPQVVNVEASGSAWKPGGDAAGGSTQVKLVVEPISGFIE